MEGNVKFFNVQKGFGFISTGDGKDVFVHHTALAEGVRLFENDTVTFDLEESDKGPNAVNVMKTGSGSPNPQESRGRDDEPAEENMSEEDMQSEAALGEGTEAEAEDMSEEAPKTE
ncbi:MAG: CspA family cold shock protein [Patescibacteria group bacterium]|jgi:CspA family cold shock protein